MRRSGASMLSLWLLTACHPAPPGASETPAQDEARDRDPLSVTLTASQVGKLGIVVSVAAALDHRDEAIGYGTVMNHDAFAQAAADLISAQATERLSRSALVRAQKLENTPGALSADVEDTAVQKAEIDAAVLTATRQKLASLFGMNPPWRNDNTGATVQAIASGRFKLLRATFASGTLPRGKPATLRAMRIGTVQTGSAWGISNVWDAPADSTLPGRSFFALLKTQEIGEGERLQVFAPVGEIIRGVAVPAAAAVLSGGAYWCYVQKPAGVFTRVPLDTNTPLPSGYFVKKGIAVGDMIVVGAAGQLLATERGGAIKPD